MWPSIDVIGSQCCEWQSRKARNVGLQTHPTVGPNLKPSVERIHVLCFCQHEEGCQLFVVEIIPTDLFCTSEQSSPVCSPSSVFQNPHTAPHPHFQLMILFRPALRSHLNYCKAFFYQNPLVHLNRPQDKVRRRM